jgi:hypothetical protein
MVHRTVILFPKQEDKRIIAGTTFNYSPKKIRNMSGSD